ncbi:MAG: peptidylprolyl isomerase [Oscillospiraceae bacterium]|nr:peptidylprolyl isomerase [Oscillospiraceae bacterium]
MKKGFISVLALIMAACMVFSGCGQKTVNLSKVESDEMQFVQPQSGDTVAQIKTSKGDIKVILYPKYAPLAVENFVTHANEGYYDGVSFHRVVEDFIIQSGDPTGTGNGGDSIWQLPFSDEFSDRLHHYTGALAMANSGEDTNRSQFFIVTSMPENITDEIVSLMEEAGWREGIIDTYKQAGGAPNLDYRYTVFGQVYEGLEVAFAINGVKTDEDEKPKDDIVIESIEVTVIE